MHAARQHIPAPLATHLKGPQHHVVLHRLCARPAALVVVSGLLVPVSPSKSRRVRLKNKKSHHRQRTRALWNSQLNLAGKPSQLISGSLLGILGLGRQFVRARAVWTQVNQPWRLEPYWYLETQHVLCKLSFRRSCWCAGGWNTSNARGASRLPSRPTHAAAARRLTDLHLKRCGFVTAAAAEKM